MPNPYNLSAVVNLGSSEGLAIALEIKEIEPGVLRLTKGEHFDKLVNNDTPLKISDDITSTTGRTNRAWLRYVLDCWVDGVEPTLYPHEVALRDEGAKTNG